MDNKRKRTILSSKEIKKFINVWKEKINELHGHKKNNHIIEEMVLELQENCDIVLSPVEIRTRINNLTKRFRKEKQLMRKSGGLPSEWQYFEKINEFLGNFKPTTESIDDLVENSFTMFSDNQAMSLQGEPFKPINADLSSSIAASSISSDPFKATGKEDDINKKLLELAKEEMKLFKVFVQQSKETDEKCNELLRKNLEIQEKLLEALMKKKS